MSQHYFYNFCKSILSEIFSTDLQSQISCTNLPLQSTQHFEKVSTQIPRILSTRNFLSNILIQQCESLAIHFIPSPPVRNLDSRMGIFTDFLVALENLGETDLPGHNHPLLGSRRNFGEESAWRTREFTLWTAAAAASGWEEKFQQAVTPGLTSLPTPKLPAYFVAPRFRKIPSWKTEEKNKIK